MPQYFNLLNNKYSVPEQRTDLYKAYIPPRLEAMINFALQSGTKEKQQLDRIFSMINASYDKDNQQKHYLYVDVIRYLCVGLVPQRNIIDVRAHLIKCIINWTAPISMLVKQAIFFDWLF